MGKWRLHLFDPTQADLDWSNPEVRHEVADIVRFWKEKGVSGFRFDVVNLISKPEVFEDDHEGDGRRFYTDGPHVHEYLQELVREAGIDGMMTVGEMSSTTLDACLGYTRPEDHELSMAFSFHHLKVDYKNGNKWELMPADLGKLRRILSTRRAAAGTRCSGTTTTSRAWSRASARTASCACLPRRCSRSS